MHKEWKSKSEYDSAKWRGTLSRMKRERKEIPKDNIKLKEMADRQIKRMDEEIKNLKRGMEPRDARKKADEAAKTDWKEEELFRDLFGEMRMKNSQKNRNK